MDLKRLIQARLALLEQVGKKISKDTAAAISAAMEALNNLLASEETDEEAVEQAWSPVAMLAQESVTGITWSGTYNEHLELLRQAIKQSKDIPGSYKWPVWTWPDKVLVWSESYVDDKWSDTYYLADYTRDGNTFTFSNVRNAEMMQVAVIIQNNLAEIDEVRTQARSGPKEPPTPIGQLLDRGADEAPFLLQQVPFHDINIQAEKSGRVKFSGTATVADVVNSYGQVYPLAFWQHHTTQAQDMITNGQLVGADGHKIDAQGYPRLPFASELTHIFTKFQMDGNEVKFEALTLQNDAGKNLAATLLGGVALEMSTVVAAKTKRGEFQGQKVDFIQIEGSKLYSVDVVLRGASPGSTVDSAKLQAKEQKKENTMELEKLLQELKDAIAAGNDDLISKLQGQIIDAQKAAQEQAKTQTLEIPADVQALINRAQAIVDRDDAAQAQAEAVKARDKKVGEVVGAMVTANEIPQQYATIAMQWFTNLALTADDVESKKALVLQSMKPMLEATAKMQSKGFYIPEYKQDDTKKHLETPAEAIEDLVQSRVKQGKLQDTGTADPGNPAHVTRLMLQTMAREQPGYVVAYMRMQNGDVRNLNEMVDFLQQNYRDLVQTTPEGAMTVSDSAAAIPYVMPIITEMNPQLIASRFASIQPMSKSKGTIAYWKIKDKDGNYIKVPANFTGSYANGVAEYGSVAKLKGELTTEDITPLTKKLGYDHSIESMRRLSTDWGIDASSVLVSECAGEIAREWNYNHLYAMLSGATAGNWAYGTLPPADGSYDGKQWQEQIVNGLFSVRAGIAKKTMSGTVAIVGGIDEITRILWLSKQVGSLSDKPGQGYVATGVNIQGTLTTGEELVSVDWWEDLGWPTKLLVIGRGQQWYKSGFIVAPYLGLYVTPQWVNPDTLNVSQGMISEVAEKMVDGDYFGTLEILEGTHGTPF